MRFLRLYILVSIAVLLLGSRPERNELSCREIINTMLDTIKNLNSQTCNIKSTERVGKRLLIAESFVKINYYPRKIYFRNSKGIEILWTEGTNKGNATVHTPSLPLINLDLDPYGSLMRKDQHHTIFELGSQYIGTTIAQTILRAPKEFDKHFTYAGTLTWNNRECYQIIINFPDYKYIEYTTKKGETVTSIAYKLHTSDYKIRYKNDLGGYFTTIKEGKKLTIPIPYSNKAIVYIDKKTFLPVSVKVYDEEGLYEAYEYTNMRTNIAFRSDEFFTSFKGYGF